jgi:hypothetical protein
VEFDEVADELYRLQPGEFTAARDARSAEARDSGDRPLAEAIKKLRKPTVGAWLANLLVGERPDDVDQLLELGQAIRDAQQSLAGDELRRLTQERHNVARALSAVAGRLAGELGVTVSDATMTELEGTLEASMSDPEMAQDLRKGRLATSLHYAGLGFGDMVTSPTGGRAGQSGGAGHAGRGTPGRRSAKAGGVAERTQGPRTAGRQRAGAGEDGASGDSEAVTAAARKVASATDAATTASAAADAAEREVDRLRDQATDMQAQLVSVREQLSGATRHATQLRKERDAAVVAQRRAEHELAALRKKGRPREKG